MTYDQILEALATGKIAGLSYDIASGNKGVSIVLNSSASFSQTRDEKHMRFTSRDAARHVIAGRRQDQPFAGENQKAHAPEEVTQEAALLKAY